MLIKKVLQLLKAAPGTKVSGRGVFALASKTSGNFLKWRRNFFWPKETPTDDTASIPTPCMEAGLDSNANHHHASTCFHLTPPQGIGPPSPCTTEGELKLDVVIIDCCSWGWWHVVASMCRVLVVSVTVTAVLTIYMLANGVSTGHTHPRRLFESVEQPSPPQPQHKQPQHRPAAEVRTSADLYHAFQVGLFDEEHSDDRVRDAWASKLTTDQQLVFVKTDPGPIVILELTEELTASVHVLNGVSFRNVPLDRLGAHRLLPKSMQISNVSTLHQVLLLLGNCVMCSGCGYLPDHEAYLKSHGPTWYQQDSKTVRAQLCTGPRIIQPGVHAARVRIDATVCTLDCCGLVNPLIDQHCKECHDFHDATFRKGFAKFLVSGTDIDARKEDPSKPMAARLLQRHHVDARMDKLKERVKTLKTENHNYLMQLEREDKHEQHLKDADHQKLTDMFMAAEADKNTPGTCLSWSGNPPTPQHVPCADARCWNRD